MEDEIAVVEEDPAAGRRSLDQQRLHGIVGAELFLHAVGDGLGLPLRSRRADDEVVGDGRQFAHCQDIEIRCFFVERRADRGAYTPLDGIDHVRSSLYKP